MADINLGPFPGGMNNRQPDHALPPGTFRNGVNVRVDNAGIVSRRPGMTKVYSGLNISDGYECPLGIFFREGSSIMMLNEDNTSTFLFDGVFGEHCAFEYKNRTVYFSDGLITKKILSDLTVTEWGMENPNVPVIFSGAGIYGAGRYLAAVTFADINGVESGASDILAIDINDNNGIYFKRIPTTSDLQVVSVRLYLSTANGKELYQIADLPIGTDSYEQTLGAYDEGKVLETQFVTKPPPGRIIREYNGQMYIATNYGTVFHTEPMSFDQIISDESFIQFPDVVDVMEPVTDGIWFCFGKVTEFYFGSSPDEFSPKPILEYGAVFGSGHKIKNSNNVTWYSNRGSIVAGSSGEFRNLQEENVATDTADYGVSFIQEEDGVKQLITSLKNPKVSTLVASDFMEARIIRKGE